MDSGNWWQRRQDKRRVMRRKREIAHELTRRDVTPERFGELEAELARILKAYPPKNYYSPLGPVARAFRNHPG